MTIDFLKAEVASTARMLSVAGLVEAFGHVSARLEGGGFLITPTLPMLSAAATTANAAPSARELRRAQRAQRQRKDNGVESVRTHRFI